ncbi:vacuolar protein sorting-associated protein 33B [Sarcoptes scabiei]|nr:vacuolar protein sorting-associated protein 33B [Sarcoptes scabiei]
MNLELLCVESDTIPSAIFDSAIVDDDRTLSNLITIEERYLITGSYFKCLQTDLTSSNRCELATWMLEVCEAENCQCEVFPLSMNILDRFLALFKIRKSQLQLLGSVCLFIASKLIQTRPISPQKLVYYTDWSIKLEELTDWELLVLSKLKWDVASVTPNDFVGPLLRRLCKYSFVSKNLDRIRKQVLNLIDLCSLDFNFSMYPPSMIAAASIVTAAETLLALTENRYIYKSISSMIVYQLHQMTNIEKELLQECHLQIEQKLLLTMQDKLNQQNQDLNRASIEKTLIDVCLKENYSESIQNHHSHHHTNHHHQPHQHHCLPNHHHLHHVPSHHGTYYQGSCLVANDTSIGVEY